MSFFVTLPSHSSQNEFPDNTSNAFKVRLPTPLRLLGEGWKVGLSSISLPDTNVNLTALALGSRIKILIICQHVVLCDLT